MFRQLHFQFRTSDNCVQSVVVILNKTYPYFIKFVHNLTIRLLVVVSDEFGSRLTLNIPK